MREKGQRGLHHRCRSYNQQGQRHKRPDYRLLAQQIAHFHVGPRRMSLRAPLCGQAFGQQEKGGNGGDGGNPGRGITNNGEVGDVGIIARNQSANRGAENEA